MVLSKHTSGACPGNFWRSFILFVCLLSENRHLSPPNPGWTDQTGKQRVHAVSALNHTNAWQIVFASGSHESQAVSALSGRCSSMKRAVLVFRFWRLSRTELPQRSFNNRILVPSSGLFSFEEQFKCFCFPVLAQSQLPWWCLLCRSKQCAGPSVWS